MGAWRRAAAAAGLMALLTALPATAEVAVATRLGAGLLAGSALEIVYDTSDAGRVLSRLEWPLLPAVLAATGISVGVDLGFTASIDVASGLPTRTGIMTDRDYLNGDGEVTHFSSHTALLEGALLVDARAGWRFPLSPVVTLQPYLAVSLARLVWVARDGYLQYPPEPYPPFTPWSAGRPRADVFGIGIRYEQTAWFPALGVSALLRPLPPLAVSLSFSAAPYVFCTDEDTHYFRGLEFHERFGGGFALEPAVAATWTFGGRAALRVDLGFRHVGGLVGDSWDIGTGVEGYDPGAGSRSPMYPDGAGAGSTFLRASVALDIRL